MSSPSKVTLVKARPNTPAGRPAGAAGQLDLVAIGDGVTARLPLPEIGEVTIGRGREVDARLDAASISRRHAMLRIDPNGLLSIEDLGSANGTRVRGEAVARGVRTAIKLGEVVDLGDILVSVQRHAAGERPRRIWMHAFFEAHLEEECLRAAHAGPGAVFAVLAASAVPDDEALSRALRPMDAIGIYAPGEYEAILVGATPEQAEQTARRVRSDLGRGGRVGVATYPRDGRDPDTLLAAARARLLGQSPSTPARIPPSGAMQELRRLVERVAPGTISVLILGETGVGKEVLAETIHRASKRAGKPFLKLNCAALSESLLESELFGHERGAFTGAVGTKQGLLETADGGTVFLDELGEMPMAIQVKLLRVIEERAVLRVGGLKTKPIDVRFIAATNRDLEAEIDRGAFRQDLYFRLNGISLVIPPLRDRTDEIARLAIAFIASSWDKLERPDEPAPRLSPDALALLEAHMWPGNIRELRNVMERAALLCSDGVITGEHLPADRMRTSGSSAAGSPRESGTSGGSHVVVGRQAPAPRAPAPVEPAPAPVVEPAPVGRTPLAQSIKRDVAVFEKQQILAALAECAGNQTHAARVLGISRATLVSRLDAYKIPRPRKPRG